MNKIYLILWKAKLATDTLWSLVVFNAISILLHIMVLFFTIHELCRSVHTHARKTFLAPHTIMYFVYVLMYIIVILSEIFQRNTRMLKWLVLFVSICNVNWISCHDFNCAEIKNEKNKKNKKGLKVDAWPKKNFATCKTYCLVVFDFAGLQVYILESKNVFISRYKCKCYRKFSCEMVT